MSDPDFTSTPFDAFVDAVLASGGQLAQMIDHMVRASAHSPPDAEPIPTVLRRLLKDALRPLGEGQPDADLASAAVLLYAATDLVGADIFLVPLEHLDGGRSAQRRERRRGASRRRD